MDVVITVCMILRFILHIHSLRLLPGIGHFVLTAFEMATNLVHFSVIYSIVLFTFAFIFHIMLDSPGCTSLRYAGFETILSSMLEMFKLTFGHGIYNPYFTSPVTTLTYVLFVILSGLLFMNLIIALMSTIATEIMTQPRKDVLWRMEWLDEALSIEFSMAVLGLPFCCCCCL